MFDIAYGNGLFVVLFGDGEIYAVTSDTGGQNYSNPILISGVSGIVSLSLAVLHEFVNHSIDW